MKKNVSFVALVLAVSMLCGCSETASSTPPQLPAEPSGYTEKLTIPTELTYASGTTLRMATGCGSVQTGLRFDAQTAGKGVTLADGVTYHTGDLKPTWAEVEKRLNITVEDILLWMSS